MCAARSHCPEESFAKNMKMNLVTAEDYKKLKQSSFAQVIGWATRIYRQGFEDGLREAEKEYDDPELYQVLTEEDVRKKIGDQAYEMLMDKSQ